MKKNVAEAIEYCFGSGSNEDLNAVDGLLAIADAILELAKSIQRLGLNDASTPMGAIEMLSLELKKGFEHLSTSVDGVASGNDDLNI